MAYRNGEIPTELLVRTDTGWNEDGYWEHLFTPGTLARWRALVADVLANEGVLLYITPGWNVYRPLEPQRVAKRKYGNNAAAVGFSSHGGWYQGRETMAIDVANWGRLGRAIFYHYAAKHGFIVNEFDWEPWHIIDPAPWAMPAGGGAVPFPTPAPEEVKENPMRYALILHLSTNKLILADLFGKHLFDLGSDPKSALRAYYANEDYAALDDREWESTFAGFTYVTT